MTARKANLVLVALVVGLCVAMVGGAKLASSRLASQSNKLINLQLKQASLDSEQTELASAKKQIDKYAPLAAIAKSIVPQDKDQAETVRQIVNISNSSGIVLGEVAFPKSDLGGTASKAQINLSQLTLVKGLAGVYQLPITISSDPNHLVTFNQLVGFLQKLENNRRTAQVTNITLTPDSKHPGELAFSLSINEYIKP